MKVTHVVLGLALVAGVAAPAAAQVKLEFRNGMVNLSAQNVPVRTILAEWARLGGTRIVNGDRLAGAPISLELTGITERKALDILLRNASGYAVGARLVPGSGASSFDRISILPTSSAPRTTAQAFGPPTTAPVTFRQQPQDEPQDDTEPDRATIVINGRGARQPAVVFTDRPTAPVPQPQPIQRVVETEPDAETEPASPGAANPFGVQPGSVRPGVITAPPPPPPPNRNGK